MLLDLFRWWYGEGWLSAWRSIPLNLRKVLHAFTLPVLLRTIFSPWKQIVSGGGKSIDEKFRAMIDNLISRAVGFLIRITVLIAALVILGVVAAVGVVVAAVWPLVPIAIIYCFYRGTLG